MKPAAYILALLFIGMSACQDNSVSCLDACPEDDPALEPPFALQGTVVDHLTHAPISEAVAQLRAPDDTTSIAADTTEADGAYRFDAIERDRLSLTARHEGYCPHAEDVEIHDASTLLDVFLGKRAPVVWDGWIRLDSIKVSCDDHPVNYHYQFKCRLEDKQEFASTEYIAFHFAMGYKLHYVYPEAISSQGIFISIAFGNDHETSLLIGEYPNGPANEGVFDWHTDGAEVYTRVPGEEMRDIAADADFPGDDLHVALAVKYRYQACGTGEVRWEKIPLPVEFTP